MMWSCKISRRAGQRWLGAVAGLCMVVLLPASGLASDRIYSIALHLDAAADPALSELLLDRARSSTEKAFRAVMGAAVQLRRLSATEAARLGLDNATELDLEQISQVWPSTERLLWVHVGRERNTLSVQAIEYDPLVRVLGTKQIQRTVQRTLLPETAARVALRAFTPVAEVQAVEDSKVRVKFLSSIPLRDHRSWIGLEPKMGLELICERRRAGSSEVEITVNRSSFLTLHRWSEEGAECVLVGAEGGWFGDFPRASVRYLARPVRHVPKELSVLVLRKDSGEPQEGCEVFSSNRGYSTSPNDSRGFTGASGMVQFRAQSRGVQFVSLQYEDLILQAPLMPGASSNPLVFQLRTRGRRGEFVRRLQQIYQELRDQVLSDRQILSELKQLVDEENIDELRRRVTQVNRDRLTLSDVLKSVEAIDRRAALGGEDVSKLASRISAYAATATEPLGPELLPYAQWADQLEKRQKVDEINDRQRVMDWPALVGLYERLLALDPGNKQLADELSRLRNDLKTKGPEHAQARKFVDEELPRITLGQLRDQWFNIEQATERLLAARDHLWLLKVRRSLNRWGRAWSSEVSRLVGEIELAKEDPAKAEQVAGQLDVLRRLDRPWRELEEKVSGFLRELDLLAPERPGSSEKTAF